jgi:hypothetical protein
MDSDLKTPTSSSRQPRLSAEQKRDRKRALDQKKYAKSKAARANDVPIHIPMEGRGVGEIAGNGHLSPIPTESGNVGDPIVAERRRAYHRNYYFKKKAAKQIVEVDTDAILTAKDDTLDSILLEWIRLCVILL